MPNRYAILAALALIPAGCEPAEAPGAAAVTGAAAGASIDVEYIEPDRFDDAAAEPILVYPAKFVCGEAGNRSRHTPGSYRTVVNVLNLSQFQTRIQWRFTNSQTAFQGASALIPSRGSLAMDCEFIARQFAGAVDLSDVLEGFVVIEDLESSRAVRVAVVYTALHKQLHDRPDLLPVRTAPHYCDLDDQRRLRVTVRNRGEKPAEASSTRVQFEGEAAVELPTPALDPGQQTRLEPVAVPDGEGRFVFTIAADRAEAVLESNELNNFARGACLIVE